MFIRPVGTTVSAAVRPAGRPLLRGLLARAAGALAAADDGAAVVPPSAWGEPAGPPAAEVTEPGPVPPPADWAEPGPGAGAGPGPSAADWAEPVPGPPAADWVESADWAEPEETAYEEPDLAEGEPPEEPEPVPYDEPESAETAVPPVRGGLAAELALLARLAREGLLTPEEFKAAKSLLLHP